MSIEWKEKHAVFMHVSLNANELHPLSRRGAELCQTNAKLFFSKVFFFKVN